MAKWQKMKHCKKKIEMFLKKMTEMQFESFVLQLFVVAYTSIEHQEYIAKNIKNVIICDTLAYYWVCTTIKNT